MTTLLFALASALFLLAAVVVIQVRGLIAHTIRRPTARLVSEQDVPEYLQRHFATLIPVLEAQGFRVSHYEHRQEIYLDVAWPNFTLVMANSRAASFAYLSASAAPDAALPLHLDFATFFAERVVYTMQGGAGGVVPGGNVIVADAPDYEVDQQWATHQQQLQTMTGALGKKVFPESPEAHVARWNLLTQRYFDWLSASKAVKPFKDGYRLRIGTAWKMRKQVGQSQTALQTWRVQKLATRELGPEPLLQAAETDAYFRAEEIRSAGQLEGWIKTAIFAASAVFFALLFGVAWSPSMLLLLIPVLLFHELGHFVAMLLFGYRDLQVLFMPFGAAVIGEKRDIAAWKEVIVYLAGPVPGLLLALGIALSVPDLSDRPLLTELVMLLAGLNFFNLLPLQPLDGGQLINRLLAGRMPFLPVLSQLITVGLFLLGWAFFGDSLLGLLALYLGWTMLSQVRSWWGWRKAGARLDRDAPEETNVRRAFAALATVREPFLNKFLKVRNFVYGLKVPRARWTEIVAGLAVYGLALVGPAAVWLDFDGGLVEQPYTAEYWDQRIAATDDIAVKLALNTAAGETMWMAAEDEAGKRFLNAAIELAENHGLVSDSSYATALATIASIDSDNAAVYLQRLESSLSPNDPVLANAYFEAAIFAEQGETIDWLNRAVEIYAKNGSVYEQVDAMQELASRHAERGDLRKAETILLDAIEVPVDGESEAGLLSSLADVYIRSDRLDEARQTLQKNLAPTVDEYSRASTHRELGWLELYAGQPEKAERHFEIHSGVVAQTDEQVYDELGWLARKLFFDNERFDGPGTQSHDVVLAHQLGDVTRTRAAVKAFLAYYESNEDYGAREFMAFTRIQATGCNEENETAPCFRAFSRQAALLLQAIAAVRPELVTRADETPESRTGSGANPVDAAGNPANNVEFAGAR